MKLEWGKLESDSSYKEGTDYEIADWGCCEPMTSKRSEIDGVCPECDGPTEDGGAVSGCSYSPSICETCDYRPCDGSC